MATAAQPCVNLAEREWRDCKSHSEQQKKQSGNCQLCECGLKGLRWPLADLCLNAAQRGSCARRAAGLQGGSGRWALGVNPGCGGLGRGEPADGPQRAQLEPTALGSAPVPAPSAKATPPRFPAEGSLCGALLSPNGCRLSGRASGSPSSAACRPCESGRALPCRPQSPPACDGTGQGAFPWGLGEGGFPASRPSARSVAGTQLRPQSAQLEAPCRELPLGRCAHRSASLPGTAGCSQSRVCGPGPDLGFPSVKGAAGHANPRNARKERWPREDSAVAQSH